MTTPNPSSPEDWKQEFRSGFDSPYTFIKLQNTDVWILGLYD